MLGKSQSKGMKVMYFFESLWFLPHQVFLFSGCFGIQGASLIGAAAAWTSDASSYFLKQIMCFVAAACTTHAFCYILALHVLDVLMRLGQSVCFFPDVDVLSEFGCELGCSAAAALECDFSLVNPESVLGSDGEVGHNTASSLTAGIGDQASGRVDVPGGVPQLASAASQVFGKVPGQFETEHEVHQTNCDIGKSATFQVLVKQLSGQHLAVSVHGDWLVADLAYCLQLRSLVPAEAFYLVKAGRHLDSCKTLREEKLSAGDTVHKCGRLKGGSPNFASHADWYCVACSRGRVLGFATPVLSVWLPEN